MKFHKAAVLSSALAVVSCATSGPAAAGDSAPLRDRAGAYELEVLVDGFRAPTFGHNGETHVLGHLGERYTLRVHNRSGRRIEAVVSVDGLDVLDGKAANFRKRGYLIPAYGFVDIEGWRLSMREVAAFRFSSVPASYAGRTGRARNVGVIGVAIFPEQVRRPPRPVYVPQRPHDYEQDYSYRDGSAPSKSDDFGGGAARERSSAAPKRATADAPSGRGAGSEAAPQAAEPAPSAGAIAEGRAESAAPRSLHRSNRPGLGTEFGESVSSQVQEVTFVRANASRPSTLLGARYNDREGLLALGIDVDRAYQSYGYDNDPYYDDQQLRQTADPFPRNRRTNFSRPPAGWSR